MSTKITTSQPTKTPDTPPVKRKHIWWRVLLAWLGGFIFFPILLVGLVFAGGSLFTVGQLVSMTGQNPDEYVGIEYRDKSITQIIMGISNMKFNTLEDLNNISPQVRKLIEDTLNPNLEQYGLALDWDEIKDKTFSGPQEGEVDNSIATYFSTDYLDKIKIANLIPDSQDLKGVYLYFLYDVVRDEAGNPIYYDDSGEPAEIQDPAHGSVHLNTEDPYSVYDFIGGADFLNSVINYITIKDVIDVTDTSPQILKTISNWNIASFGDRIDTLTIGSLFEQSDIDNSKFLQAIQNSTLDTLMDDVYNVKLGALFSDEDLANTPLLRAIADYSLTTLSGGINTIRIGQIIDVYQVATGYEAGTDYYYYDEENDKYVLDEAIVDASSYNAEIGVHNKLYVVSNPLIKALENFTMNDFSDQSKIDAIKIGDLISGADNALFDAISDYTVGDLRTKDLTTLIKIGDIYPAGDPDERSSIIKALSNYYIADLNKEDVIMGLKLVDVLGEETMLENDILKSIYNDNPNITLGGLDELNISNFKLVDLLGITTIEGNSILNALYGKDPEVTVGDLTDESTIMSLTLADIIDVSGNDILKAISEKGYYEEGHEGDPDYFHVYSIDELSEALDDLTLHDVYPDATNSILKAIANAKDTDGNFYKINDLGGAIDQLEIGDLITIDESTPLILKTLAENHTKVTELGTVINTLTIDQVIAIDPDDPNTSSILKCLIGTSINGLSEKIDSLTLFDVLGDLDPTEDMLLYGIARQGYYEEGHEGDPAYFHHYSVKDLDKAVGQLTITDIIEIDSSSSQLLQALATKGYYEPGHEDDPDYFHLYTINDLGIAVAALTLEEVIDIDEETSPKIFITLKDCTLETVDDVVLTLQLKDVINIDADSHPILKAISEVHLFDATELVDTMDALKFSDIFSEEDVGTEGVLRTLWDNTNGGDFLISDIASEINKLNLIDFLGDQIYATGIDAETRKFKVTRDEEGNITSYTRVADDYTPTEGEEVVVKQRIAASWWYLLTEEGETFTDDEKGFCLKKGADYKFTQLTQLVTNMDYHMKHESVFNLYEAKLITMSAEDVAKLNVTVMYKGTLTKLGDLNISQFIEYAMSLVPTF